jgi:copper homeostasis protein
MLYEVCIDSVEGALAAQNVGAQRVELCANLVEGGTTPSLGMIELTRQRVSIDVNVIVRPRGGDFCYSELEFEVMLRDVQTARAAGANGVVIGLLLPDGSVDRERTKRLIEAARPMSVTFHRAFDMCRVLEESLETLVDLGVNRLLTSCQKKSAIEGADCIARLVSQAGERIIIMAGGGVTAENLPALAAVTGIKECHFSARRAIDSSMNHRNPDCFMGKAYLPNEYTRQVPDEAMMRQIVQTPL